MVEIIDYSSVYYTAKEGPPPQRQGKFVVLDNSPQRFIVFSPIELSGFHANIAERFFRDQSVTGHYNSKNDHYYIDCEEWIIQGGGHWQLDEGEGTLEIFGVSMAYGGVDLEEVASQLERAQAFGGVSILVM